MNYVLCNETPGDSKEKNKGEMERLTCCNKPNTGKTNIHIYRIATLSNSISQRPIFSKNGECWKCYKILAILTSSLIGKPTKCESVLLNGNVILNVSFEVVYFVSWFISCFLLNVTVVSIVYIQVKNKNFKINPFDIPCNITY